MSDPRNEVPTDNPAALLARWQQGDQQAATELFHRYAGRLIALARSRLPDALAQRLDPEDVVQSAYRSFFSAARDGRFEVRQGGDLWQLLVVITLQKVRVNVRRNSTRKRAVGREQALGADDLEDFRDLLLSPEPSPLEAVALVDEVQRVMRTLPPAQRRILELRLQGCRIQEIVAQTGLSEITVRRALQHVKRKCESWYGEGSAG